MLKKSNQMGSPFTPYLLTPTENSMHHTRVMVTPNSILSLD